MEQFGPYVLLEKVAAGGMAEIFKARMTGAGGFERLVAVKRLRPEFAASAEYVQMLIDEAKIVARISHSNVAQVLTLDRVNESWALILEYVDGVDLFRLERALEQHERRLGVDECVHVVKELLQGLESLHRLADEQGEPLGLVHCDVSPGNVMITTAGQVKLIDFGVTRATGAPMVGMPGGKVRYRAPEQVRSEDFDNKSDLYSAGVVLWELLAGERVYESLMLEEILDRVAKGEVPPIEEVRAGVPEGLVRVLRRALFPDPRYRYPHAGAFLRALEDLPIGRDPTRSRHVLSELVRVLLAPQRAPGERNDSVVRVAEELSLEDVLEGEFGGGDLEAIGQRD